MESKIQKSTERWKQHFIFVSSRMKMIPLKISILGLLTFACNAGLLAQKDFIPTSYPVLSFDVNKQETEVVFTDGVQLYWADTKKFELIDSFYFERDPNNIISDVRYSESNSDMICIKTKSYGTHYFEFAANPEDSLYTFNLRTKTVVARLSGNIQWAFGTENSRYAIGYDALYRWATTYGDSLYGISYSQLGIYPEELVYDLERGHRISHMVISPDNSQMAILYYLSYPVKVDYPYLLELRSIPDFKLLGSTAVYTKSDLTVIQNPNSFVPLTYPNPPHIYFDDSGAFLFLEKPYNWSEENNYKSKDFLQAFDTKNWTKLHDLSASMKHSSLISDGKMWCKEHNSIVQFDLKTRKKLVEIWANLTPFNSVTDFYPLRNGAVLISGEESTAMPNSKNGLYNYSLKDNAIYSSIADKNSVVTLFNPDAVNLQNNAFIGDKIQQSKDSRIVLARNANHIQLWNIPEKSKLYDFTYTEKIVPFLHPAGTGVLIFEANEQKGWSDFVLKYLDLKTGAIASRMYSDLAYGEFSFSSTIECVWVSDLDSGARFICTNDAERLWEINTNNLSVNELASFENTDFRFSKVSNLHHIPGTSQVVFNVYSYENDNNFKVTKEELTPLRCFDFDVKKEVKIAAIKNEMPVYFVSDEYLAYQSKNQIVIRNLTSTASQDIKMPADFELENVIRTNNQVYLFLTKSATDSTLVYTLDKDFKKKTEFKLAYGDLYFSDGEGIGYEHSERLFTYFPGSKQILPWKTDQNLFTQDDDISLNSNGLLLFRHKWLVSLENLEIEAEVPAYASSVLLTKNAENVVLQVNNQTYTSDGEKPYFTLRMLNLDTREIIWESPKNILKGGLFGMNKIELSANENFAIIYEDGIFTKPTFGYLLNLSTKSLTELTNKDGISVFAFAPDEKTITLQSFPEDNTITYSTLDFKKLKDFSPAKLENKVQINGQFLSFSTNGKDKTYFARQYLSSAVYLETAGLLAAGSDAGNLVFWKVDNQSPEKIIPLGSAKVLKIIPFDKKLIALMANSEVKIIDIKKMELDATLAFFERDENVSLVWYTPEGYFKANKSDIRNFHFVKGLNAFPVLSYELFLNRPDTILQKLGFADQEAIEIYRQAYEKRLKRNGVSSLQDFRNLVRPQIELTNRNAIPALVNESTLNLEIALNQTNAPTKKVSVFVNGVPVINKNTNEKELNLLLELNEGENQITIIGLGANGVESDPISLTVQNNSPVKEHRVYYVGIGVSHYADNTMNLKFADKDVRRLADYFGEEFKERLIVDTLTNEQATHEKILALKEKLKTTSVNDVVILSFSGHGLIDNDKNFYFACHDIDFNQPEKMGLSYDEIIGLLSDIPARKKLLLMDACHSGELDSEDEIRVAKLSNPNVSASVPRGVEVIEETANKAGLNASFDLMKTLFYDTDRGNGAFVISASGGKEFAFENAEWGNGVFTYSVINALDKLSYDTWKGYQPIKISALQKEVYKQVIELTNGQQKPTARAENSEWDWELK